ncbi:TPA: hypothetical protein DEP96_00455 [Candidatus Uhrbacteria bacterium]|nr:hypothetical protein [Candidatus Uhrbacteria bacterium]
MLPDDYVPPQPACEPSPESTVKKHVSLAFTIIFFLEVLVGAVWIFGPFVADSVSATPVKVVTDRLADDHRIISGIHERNAEQFAVIDKAYNDCSYHNSYDGGIGWVEGCYDDRYLEVPADARNLFTTRTDLTRNIRDSVKTWGRLCSYDEACDKSTASKRRQLARASAVFDEAGVALRALYPQLDAVYNQARRASEATAPHQFLWTFSNKTSWEAKLNEQLGYQEKLNERQTQAKREQAEYQQRVRTEQATALKAEAAMLAAEQKLDVFLYNGEAWENVTTDVLWAAISMTPNEWEWLCFGIIGAIFLVTSMARKEGTGYDAVGGDLTTPRIIEGKGWFGLPILVGGYDRRWKVSVSFLDRTTILTDSWGNQLRVEDVTAPYLPELLATSSLDFYLRNKLTKNSATTIEFPGQQEA